MAKDIVVKVIITDDHQLIRDGLRSLLVQDQKIEVIGEAANGQELLDLLSQASADVVLMDINMPVMNGYEATQQIRSAYPGTKVIALSMLHDEPFVQKMMASGASGYILKASGKDELRSAIKLVANGTIYISSELTLKMLDKATKPEAVQENELKDGNLLTKREQEVLLLISEGYTNAEIADKLFTSKRTVENHRQNILEKTQVKDTAHLIKYAIQHKLIDLDPPKVSI
ncbi:response regulator [Pontibacter silvestris]|uniref:Response regulator n=1 Tax=Pontibacter silvestris TaxID=2305183 RepID=A0ABW4WTI7_9BACT|nr:response regulator transcription factor [Pontibacter silvestris]MCC9138633.1 response regulator transcription factor [Pontibacter silvestris]